MLLFCLNCNLEPASKYGTIACCTVEKSPDFSAATGSMALAVICRVLRPSKEQHAVDCYIESMEHVAPEDKPEPWL